MPLGNIFNEICKISTINATKALSKFLQEPIGVDINPIQVNQVESIMQLISPEEITVNLSVPIKGNLSGASFFLYSYDTALLLSDILLKRKKGTTKAISKEEISALRELANVVIGHFLGSFAELLQIKYLLHNPAQFSSAPFNQISGGILSAVNDHIKQTVLQISFEFLHEKLNGLVLIVLDEPKVMEFLRELKRAH